MKKTDIVVPELTDKKLPSYISQENKQHFPQEMEFAFEYIQANPIVFPERHLRVQKRHLKRKANRLFQKEGALAPKIALLKLLATLPDFIPANMLVELCAFALDYWQQKIKKPPQH